MSVQQGKNNNNDLMRYMGLATQWLVMLGLAVWGGLWLDKRTGLSFPLLTVLLPLLALGVSLWQLIKSLK